MRIRRAFAATVGVFRASSMLWAQDRGAATKGQAPRRASVREAKVRPLRSPEFGGVNVQYQRISAMQFTSDVSADVYTSTWDPENSGFGYQRYWFADGFNHLVSSPTLPGGAKIVYLELDACDSSTIDAHVQVSLWNCDFVGNCDSTPFATATSTSDVAAPCSNFSVVGLSQRVDNFLGQTLVDVTFGAADDTNTLAGVIIGYVLEVSPAPKTATFNDVPTEHPFFQFIEALAESGVTGGCSAAPPLYCPNNFVTRGQM